MSTGIGIEKATEISPRDFERLLLRTLSAMKKGDFKVRMPVEFTGGAGKIADTLNEILDLSERSANEVERIANVVGKEGKLTQRAQIPAGGGQWAVIADSVNSLVSDLVQPTNEISRVIGAVARGDLSRTMATEFDGRPLRGEFLRMAKTVNTMVAQLASFASEVTRVAREVGTEGKLGGQADVKGVAGTWKDLTESVNSMASNLTGQVRNIAEVTTAVALGDLSKKITAEARGEILELKNTINTMVDQLRSFASEVTRVAREVGSEGKLSGQADVKGVSGTWKDLTDSVNSMAANLTSQVRNIAEVTTAVANGDLSKKITAEALGEILELKETINTMVDQLRSFASEVTRVAREVGTEGRLGGQAEVPGVAGTWKDLTDSVNAMASNLTGQVRNIADVTTAVATGDLSKKITVEVRGEMLELKNTINTMVDQLNSFAAEVTRVAREVGTEGKLGGQADVKGVAGTWKDLTDSVNSMAGNLTGQVRNIAEVTTAVALGDLSKKITAEAEGEILELKNTINTMVDQLNSFAAEVTRVAREVGTEGRLGGQAEVTGVAGTWKDLTDSVNAMAGNLTGQVRNIAEVTTAVALGDLSKKITVDVRGELLELKVTINTMVDQLRSFAAEVTRVAREVGTEGKLGGQAEVKGVAGTWKDLTDSVNSMAGNLTGQVRNIAEVTTAVALGDLSKKITAEAQGEILELKNTINSMVDQLNSFAAEVTRVAGEVGTEGKLGGQAQVRGVAGTWKDLTDNVNSMASNLTNQVRNIAQVTTAVANGDLSKKINVDVKGEMLELKNTINSMVDQLNSFAAEVTRVATEVGTEGKLGGQAQVKGVAGTWKDLTDSVNSMAGNLTGQVRNIADVTTAVANGDLSKKITADARGEILELKNTINTMVDQLNTFAGEVTRVAREVGTDGRLGGQAQVKGVSGTWKDLTDSVNYMASNLTNQVRNIAQVTTAVANGDLSKKITVDVKGEMLELKDTVNTMVDQLNSFAAEVTRVAREVGTEGKLGGQAQVKGVGGTWKDLTDNVNMMASNLTNQVRGIAKVVTAVARGVLKQKLNVESRGEIGELADTINDMIDTLATFADQVTTVAREVGVEGKLGGQANVPGASGTWRDLTDNVNQLAANLTTQVRAIADVATAVAKGDLSRNITVQAEGELAALKGNLNEMIRNLRETTSRNTEQDWLKTNLAKFTRMMQGQKNLTTVSQLILSELAPVVGAKHGVFYVMDANGGGEPVLKLASTYAYKERKYLNKQFRVGEGIVGQAAFEKQRILLQHAPDDYITINSGLGEAKPMQIVVLPIVFEGQVLAVMELASFMPFNDTYISLLDQLTESIGVVLNTIQANMRTEELLAQSQSLAEELQAQQEELTETNKRLEQQAKSLQASEELLKTQQEELQQTNEELEEKARLLQTQNEEVERKNREVENAKRQLEEKARQLALTSKYKSEFLANMSHELRTPLNSLLILARLLADNPENNLTGKQVEFASTIHSSGVDLLTLINDILDLSKIESGMMTISLGDLPFTELADSMDKTFRQMSDDKRLDFNIELDPSLPRAIHTDATRLQQVLKNLLGNAFKFTEKGGVTLKAATASAGWSPGHETLDRAPAVIAFTVSDTGIGIADEKQQIIFEAFQQADASTTRRFGGTGLGLSISREIARLLGGEIRVTSDEGVGSAFTLYLPQSYVVPTRRREEERNGSTIEAALTPDVSLRHAGDRPSLETRRTRRDDGGPSGETQLIVEEQVTDDRGVITEDDRVVLIVEDDVTFAGILLEMAHDKGFKGIVATRGESGLQLARRYRPDAITLDIALPDMEGWTVLDRLKHDKTTRHIPVHIISGDEESARGLKLGALAQVQKPVTKEALDEAFAKIKGFVERPNKSLLIVEDNPEQRSAIAELIGGDGDVDIASAASGGEALQILRERHFDCMVLDLGLPDMNGFEFINRMRNELGVDDIPIVVYTGRELTKKEELELKRMAEAIIVKDARSPERLLDETALFLHRVEANLPEQKRQILEQLHESDPVLAGKKALIVDDDMRNIYALTSLLERHKMDVVYAESGADGIEQLRSNPDIDVVLMDVMMPEMDGYEAMRRIRAMDEYRNLPMIALTAKAMKGDREKCMEAGASDYITKPIDAQQLISLLRVWLYL
ncbi:MAG TPA: HAMP domain-containing protein [Thermoanaerobaculia bacterium]|jgi:HAMP domain-containing protein/CheY-like chemotaxis protein/signal transduction histidine kinase|nr:HAMP domain-containing protein [Thermoanaerobaculia bacterium]